MSNNINPSEVSEILLRELRDIDTDVKFEETGVVLSIGDGVAHIYGLTNVTENELIEFENGVMAVAMNLEEDNVGAVLLGSSEGIKEGMKVKRTTKVASIEVSEQMLGRVINPLGNPVDGGKAIEGKKYLMPLDRKAPGVIYRQPVTQALQTGLKSVDSMIPIGRGQRELIIGDRQTGKTAIAIDTIINQKQNYLAGDPVYCIYVAIGQKASTVANIVNTLKEAGAMDYTIIVSATAGEPAAMQYYAPFAGAAIGEFFRDRGMHALVVYDDLSKQAVAYREVSLILRRPSGREAYPGDIFYLHSRLLERAVKMSKKNGYGSMTALPIIETQDGDVSAYIPTNVISITDGQIYLQSELFFQGQRPAVDVGISVSRVGGDAQTKAMKQVAGNLRLDLASYQELAGFTQFGSDLDEATQKQLTHGARMTELLKQPRYKPFEVGEQIVTLFAGNEGFLDDLEIADVLPFRAELIEYMDNGFGSLLDKVRAKKIDDDTKAELLRVIGDFKQQFMAKHHSDVSGSEEN